MQKKLILEEYINKLSSKEPTPGGGSAAALVSALSSSLTAMMLNLTVGKKRYEGYSNKLKKEIDDTLKDTLEFNEKFLAFMDEDEKSFLTLMDAFKLPKDTEEEKEIRKKEIDNGYEIALNTPLNLAREALCYYENIFTTVKYGNPNLISDAGVASILLYSAIESSILNVKINLSGIEDKFKKEDIVNECNKILESALNYKIEIMEIVESKIK
ncbi:MULTISPECIES: cyclodeaminase/cyclohydrolase family protein [Clostridium]|uniref:Formiminotransferase-cyclodeaminase/formiminotetrahydrofolate cyclodeaminase, putative n=1 Tax=Clostridium novyi (strain NT) TaxID=386415 RepID=A0PZS3_CLONN|nr:MULTISPECIES: cyclodeaminase/cyclohydrolase family protein [Clostridium]ABK62163.1 formiminotransferase-cyclodeaminase/formiminotetrahydrofolate cyclodeaminase, putative [Clostridium novyi NT]KEH84986.1 methenyltetrahydrofolate cyclohydrolase [Clostridium novyi A str. 4540]KEH86646.1 methenyltetrahydrofolate cyclohydrolase [Clostridium novyi A str. BKT29909]KEH88420.1 methenyltetrahydrofolate cyclohydrolase [Clostridium novyi A str. NCTC 538]KEH90213.1 methenyltetrahydrofolate cyclohydrolas